MCVVVSEEPRMQSMGSCAAGQAVVHFYVSSLCLPAPDVPHSLRFLMSH